VAALLPLSAGSWASCPVHAVKGPWDLPTDGHETGYTGGHNTLNRYVRPLRGLDAATLAELPPRPAPPAVRHVAGSVTGLAGRIRTQGRWWFSGAAPWVEGSWWSLRRPAGWMRAPRYRPGTFCRLRSIWKAFPV